MKLKTVITLSLVVFLSLCLYLVIDTGIFKCDAHNNCLIPLASQSAENDLSTPPQNAQSFDLTKLKAASYENKTITLGSRDIESPFFFEIDFDTKGASISSVKLNRHEDFTYKDEKPFLEILKPINIDSEKTINPLASDTFVIGDQKINIRNLNWQLLDTKDLPDQTQSVSFTATILDAQNTPAVQLTKTYTLTPDQHHINVSVSVKNLTDKSLTSQFDIQSPMGLPREGVRTDMRKIIASYQVPGAESELIKLQNVKMRSQIVKWLKGKQSNLEMLSKLSLAPEATNANLFWVANVDKYFAAIVHPIAQPNEDFPTWAKLSNASYNDPKLRQNASAPSDGTDNSSFKIQVKPFDIEPAQQKNFSFMLYLGAKDKDLFQKDETYSGLAFIKAIDFQSCCSVGWITSLAFLIVTAMSAIYVVIPNYGIVIIILVLIVRLCLHPLTKKSQMSMMKMQKLAPMSEEIKKKYANNKAEMNKQMMTLYKEHGASPLVGCLPMALQMPIWIALYSAIYASVELRGAEFLPFWITDLSAPDALIRFKAFTLPLLNARIDSFNLLPLLLGVSMFLQQKLMPHSSASANPQAAQQQKMMQWMMPIMMLVFLYKAPAGLNLYIMTSTFAGVIEQIVIRKHIREKEAAESQGLIPVTKKTGGKTKKKKPKPFIKY